MKPTADDVTRSLRRYLSQTLEADEAGKSWRIRLEREQVKDDQRPVAVLDLGRIAHPFRRAALDQGAVTAAAPVTVTAYPETAGTVRAAGLRARTLQQHLEDVGTFGLDLGSAPRFPGGPPRPRAGPGRIPVYDFAGVAVEGPAADRRLPAGAEPIGWARVEDSGTDAVQDPEDPRRWSVVWELRLSWERGGRVAQVGAPALAGVPNQQPPPLADPDDPDADPVPQGPLY